MKKSLLVDWLAGTSRMVGAVPVLAFPMVIVVLALIGVLDEPASVPCSMVMGEVPVITLVVEARLVASPTVSFPSPFLVIGLLLRVPGPESW